MSDADPLAAAARAVALAEEALRREGLTADEGMQAWLDAFRAHRSGGTVPASLASAMRSMPTRADVDAIGLAYQQFLPYRFKARFGQFFTPRPVARLVVARAGIRAGERVVDPFAGSGGLLLLAARAGATVHGVEIDPSLAALAHTNLHLHGHDGTLGVADAFREDLDADVIVANPPFSLRIDDPTTLAVYGLSEPAPSELVFSEALHRWVRPHGRAAVVLPHSVLTAPQQSRTRRALQRHFAVEAVCELPEGVFRPFGGAQGRAVILWLVRDGSSLTAWARVRDPGYDVGRRGLRTTPGNDIDRLIAGEGWRALPAGTLRPEASVAAQGRVGDRATLATARRYPAREAPHAARTLDLADVDRATGAAHLRDVPDTSALKGVRFPVQPGDVCVARLRPERGVVTVVPACADRVVYGSPEWVVLRTAHPYALFHLVRTPAWRRALPEPSGQTRPRLRTADVMEAPIRWPADDTLQRLADRSRALHREQERITAELTAIQAAVDAFAAGDIDDDALSRRLTEAGGADERTAR